MHALSLIIHISRTIGANSTKFIHNHLHMYSFKCGYIAAIWQLCMVVAQIDLFGGAGEAIATSVPGLLEMIVRSPCGACLLASCQPPAGRAYAYVVARDNHRRNAINKPHSVLSDASRSPYGVRAVSRRFEGGKPSARRLPPNLDMFKFRGIYADGR